MATNPLEFEVIVKNGQAKKIFEETKKAIQDVTNASMESGLATEESEVRRQRSIGLTRATYQALTQAMQKDLGSVSGIMAETKLRMQDFSGSVAAGGPKMEAAYQAAGQTITQGFEKIHQSMTMNSSSIEKLQAKYNELRDSLSKIPASNPIVEHIQKGMEAIQQQIVKHKEANAELAKVDETLVKYNRDLEEQKNKTDNAANAHVRFRTQLMNVKQQMMELEQAGKKNTAEYARLVEEAKRLANAMYAANQQIKNLTTTKGVMLQGFVSGLSGISGAFTAVNGAMGLFASKNEDLQKIMLKVQSLMSITMGLQAVSAMLHETSAFKLAILTKVQAAYSAVLLASGKALIRFGLSANAARTAVQLFYGTLTLGLVFLPVLITLINKWISTADRQKEAAERAEKALKKQHEKIKEMADAYSKELAKIQSLRTVLDSENVSRTRKVSIIKELKKQIPGYTAELDKEGRVIRENKKAIDEYIKSLEKSIRFKSDEKDLAAVYSKKYEYEKKYANAVKVFEEKLNMPAEEQNKLKERYKVEYNTYKQAIAALDKEADRITGRIQKQGLTPEPQTTEKSGKDPFLEKLEKQKKAYQDYFKWLDAGLEKEAKQEFAKLLEGGDNYMKYLQKLKNDTALTQEQIHQVTTEIASETNKTVMSEFQKSLQSQIDSAANVLDLIDLIKRRREELANSDDPLKQQKMEILNKESDEADRKKSDETRSLLKSYSDYLNEKINFELQYGERKNKLDEDLAKASTEAERRIILAHLAGLEKDRKKYAKQTGNEDYDSLMQEYRDFEQKKTDLAAEFEEKRQQLSQQLENRDISEKQREQTARALQKIDEDYKKAISKLAADELTESGSWKKLFDNLDELTASQIDVLLQEIESKFETLSVEFNPIDLKIIKEKLNEAKTILIQDNPFKQIGIALREIFNEGADGSKKTSDQIKKDWKNLGKATEGAFKFVEDAISSADFLKDAIGEIGATAIGTLSTVATVAIATATAIKTAEKSSVILAIIQAVIVVIQAVANLVKSIIASNDKKLEKQVQQHLANVKTLQKEYQKLEREVSRALGENRYTTQRSELENLKKQQKEFAEAASAERQKKKEDAGKIAEYEDAAEENAFKMLDIVDKIREEIIGGTAADIANDLGNALIDAFAAGEDALGAFKKKADEVVSSIIQRMLIQKLIEQPVGQILDRYQKKWVDDKGNFLGFDQIMKDAGAMGDELKSIGAGFSAAMESLPEEIKKYLLGTIDDEPVTSLSGAIKGASQESINILAGTTNAVRDNQIKSMEILRNQLLHLASIDAKIGVSNYHLENISDKLNNTYEVLRAQGITD
jgi:chromosome segregation ATPase